MPGREINDLHGVAVVAEKAGDQHGGVLQVVLLGVVEILQLDRPVAALGGGRQQRAEAGVVVEAGQAAPYDARMAVDQCGDAAVADHAQLKAGGRRGLRELGHGWVHGCPRAR